MNLRSRSFGSTTKIENKSNAPTNFSSSNNFHGNSGNYAVQPRDFSSSSSQTADQLEMMKINNSIRELTMAKNEILEKEQSLVNQDFNSNSNFDSSDVNDHSENQTRNPYYSSQPHSNSYSTNNSAGNKPNYDQNYYNNLDEQNRQNMYGESFGSRPDHYHNFNHTGPEKFKYKKVDMSISLGKAWQSCKLYTDITVFPEWNRKASSFFAGSGTPSIIYMDPYKVPKTFEGWMALDERCRESTQFLQFKR